MSPQESAQVLPSDVVSFWREAGPKRWFAKSEAFDADIRARFEAVYRSAAAGLLAHWEKSPEGALALLLLLDQFSRNMYRGSAQAFAADPLARRIADGAITAGYDQTFRKDLRVFFYLPFEHSEDIVDQDRSVALMTALGDKEFKRYAEAHRDVIKRFGRFPHRNEALGRESTDEEKAWLADGGGF